MLLADGSRSVSELVDDAGADPYTVDPDLLGVVLTAGGDDVAGGLGGGDLAVVGDHADDRPAAQQDDRAVAAEARDIHADGAFRFAGAALEA